MIAWGRERAQDGDGGAPLSPSELIGVWALDGAEGEWLGAASSAGFDGDVLVLVDRAGEELGRVVRDVAPAS